MFRNERQVKSNVDLGKKVRDTLMLVVDYVCPLQDAIVAGNYDFVNESITAENFPPHEHERGKKPAFFKLFHFNRYIESKAAITEMDKQGYRPASLRELLAYGKENPELQRQFPIIALLSVWVDPSSGYRHVPVLWGNIDKRSLRLDYFEDRWASNSRFLAVRKY